MKDTGRKKTVLVIGPDSVRSSGGIASITRDLLNSSELSAEFDLFEHASYRDGCLPYRLVYSACAFAKFVALGNRYDLYHIHMASYSSTWRKLAYAKVISRWNKPVVLHVHGGEYGLFYRSLKRRGKDMVRRALSSASAVIVLSDSWASFFSAEVHLPNTKVMRNGVDVEKIGFSQGEPGRIVFVGRLEEQKGAFDLLDALALLKRNSAAKFKCTFCGSGDLDKAREFAQNRGLGNSVEFTGQLDEPSLYAELHRSSIMVLPSYHEGLPMSMLEAMAAGNAIVVTDVGGIPEATCAQGSIIVKPGDTNAIEQALVLLLSTPGIIENMADSNHRFVRERFDIGSVHTQLKGIYESCLEDSK